MADERKGPAGIGEGIRAGVGMLMALKEALEETVNDALERGDLSPERAREVMQDASERLQKTVEEARDRLEMVPRKEFDELKREVLALQERLDRLEGGGGSSVWSDTPRPLPGQGASPDSDESGAGPRFPVD